jgi:hypothetical protein
VLGALSLRVKELGFEADHSTSCSAMVMNEWSYIEDQFYHVHDHGSFSIYEACMCQQYIALEVFCAVR